MNRIGHMALALTITSAITSSLTGCLDDGQGLDDDTTELASVESAITVVPQAGGWIYGELAPLSTTCSFAFPVEGQSGPFSLDSVTVTGFRVLPNDGTAPFTCSYAEAQFKCANRLTQTFDLRPSTDARLTVKVTATGVMSDSRHARGKQDALVTCVGTQCSQFGRMPCGYVDTFEVHKP